jgi:hypothetical protein
MIHRRVKQKTFSCSHRYIHNIRIYRPGVRSKWRNRDTPDGCTRCVNAQAHDMRASTAWSDKGPFIVAAVLASLLGMNCIAIVRIRATVGDTVGRRQLEWELHCKEFAVNKLERVEECLKLAIGETHTYAIKQNISMVEKHTFGRVERTVELAILVKLEELGMRSFLVVALPKT